MYKSNGIELSSNEFTELLLLVNARASGKDVCEFAESRLKAPDNTGFYSTRLHAYKTLCEKGLLYGDYDELIRRGQYVFLPSEAGIDFVCDVALREKSEEELRKSSRSHDYKVAAFGIIGGLFSGALGSWLFEWLSYFVSQMPA